MALVATAALLGACASAPAPVIMAANGECRVKTIRELRQAGPQGKSAPMFVDRQVQSCEPASAAAKPPILTH
jgi:hypothetical protein